MGDTVRGIATATRPAVRRSSSGTGLLPGRADSGTPLVRLEPEDGRERDGWTGRALPLPPQTVCLELRTD
ncbi:hypothetical protein ACFV24_34440 [Nocardia fluminea]|uniref:hypothetical protein n=1 Tax=Nocardia fluminea TaxID=134984 RepID=UPI00366C196D